MNDKELQQAFLQFLAKKSGAKNQKELEKYVQSLGEDGLKQAYDEFTKVMQSQAQKAAHGAKLQYFKNLKHKCAEGEELVFYKKGGSVECGCKGKVMEKGGEVPDKNKKLKKAGAGCIAEFKSKRRFAKGGSLNGIPFYLAGTPEGGLPAAQNAEERYTKGKARKMQIGPNTKHVLENGLFSTGVRNPFVYPAQIQQNVQGTDTTYTEYPRHFVFIKGVPRTASSSDTNRSEYDTLKRRFNIAWNNATPMTW